MTAYSFRGLDSRPHTLVLDEPSHTITLDGEPYRWPVEYEYRGGVAMAQPLSTEATLKILECRLAIATIKVTRMPTEHIGPRAFASASAFIRR